MAGEFIVLLRHDTWEGAYKIESKGIIFLSIIYRTIVIGFYSEKYLYNKK